MGQIKYLYGQVGQRTNGYCDFCDYQHSDNYLWHINNDDGNVVLCPHHYQEYIETEGKMRPCHHRCEQCWIDLLGSYVWRQIELTEIDQLICEQVEHCKNCNRKW